MCDVDRKRAREEGADKCSESCELWGLDKRIGPW